MSGAHRYPSVLAKLLHQLAHFRMHLYPCILYMRWLAVHLQQYRTKMIGRKRISRLQHHVEAFGSVFFELFTFTEFFYVQNFMQEELQILFGVKLSCHDFLFTTD